eukprot:m.138542 g.138542  ORF g.138542 m.138542 type:complete len:406 (+) comp15219_c0_seq1:142-1359(+)
MTSSFKELLTKELEHVCEVARDAGLRFGVVGSEHLFYGILECYEKDVREAFALSDEQVSRLKHRMGLCPTFHRTKQRYEMLVFSTTYDWILQTVYAIANYDNDEILSSEGEREDAEKQLRQRIGKMLIQGLVLVCSKKESMAFSYILPLSSEELTMIFGHMGPCAISEAPEHALSIATFTFLDPPGEPDVSAIKDSLPPLCLPEDDDASLDTSLHSAHWVVPGRIMCGSSPGKWDRRGNELRKLIVGYGVDVMVCLQESYSEYGGLVYPTLVQKNIQPTLEKGHVVHFMHCPIPDFGCLEIAPLVAFVDKLVELVAERGRVIYIHCYGGHGRTGTIVSMLISAIGQKTHRAAMKTLQLLHSHRHCAYCALNDGHLEADEQTRTVQQTTQVLSRGHYKLNKHIHMK